MRKNAGGILVAVLFAILSSNVGALAESLWWTGATQAADGTSFTSAEMSRMTYYVRIDKPNPRDTGGTGGWYYLGETRGGGLSYPADNSLASLMRSYGFGTQTVRFTVSQAFVGSDGVERDSVKSDPLSWVVPAVVVPPPPPVTPGKPTGCLIK